MESGSGPQSPGPFASGSSGPGPGGQGPDDEEKEPNGPRAPAPEGPQSPVGPQSPAPGGPQGLAGPQSPSGHSPPPPPGQSPQPQFAPPAGTLPPSAPPPPGGGYGGPQAPGYGGPVPPGGWQQPLSTPSFNPPPGQVASWGSRAGAVALDFVFVWVPIAVAVAVIVGAASASTVAGVIVGVVLGLASLAYWFLGRSLLMARGGERNGQTWGKQIVGIRVVRDRGEPFDVGWALLRQILVKWLLFWVFGSSFLIPWVLNYLWPLWDDSDRALHDMIVTTHVVRA